MAKKNVDKKLVNLLKLQDNSDNEYRRTQVRKNSQQTLLYLSEHLAPHNQRFYTLEGDPNTYGSSVTQLGRNAPDPDFNPLSLDIREVAGYVFPEEPKLKQHSYDTAAGNPDVGTGAWSMSTNRVFGWRSGYANITPFLSSARSQPGYTPSRSGKSSAETVVSRLFGVSPAAAEFFSFRLSSAQMAALVPKIEIFKIDYKLFPKEIKPGVPHPKAGQVDHEGKTDIRPIIFDKMVTKDELVILQSAVGGGNIGGNGIKSFRWALKGVNPAEVDANIEATLEIYFNNVNTFQKILDDIDSRAGAAAGTVPVSMGATFLDLITFAPPSTEGLTNLPCLDKYDPSFFEIKIDVGWDFALLEGKNPLFTAEELEFIKELTTSLYLTLTDHKFDFREDGSATLVVNYRARQTLNTSRGYDILKPRPNTTYEAALASLETTRQQADDYAQAGNTKAQEETTEDIEQLEERIAAMQKSMYADIIFEIINNAYAVDVPNALLLNGFSAWSGNGEEYTGLLSYSQVFSLLQGNKGGTVMSRAVVDKISSAAKTYTTQKINVARWNPVPYNPYGGSDFARGHAASQLASGERDPLNDANLGRLLINNVTEGIDETTQVVYLYLGDILEIIIESTEEAVLDIVKKKLSILLADFKFINYLKLIENVKFSAVTSAFSYAGVSLSKVRCQQASLSRAQKQNLYGLVNLANLPISLHLFLDFFVNEVVAPQKTSYYLEDFITNFFNKLVKPAIGDPGIFGAAANQPILINAPQDTSIRSNGFSTEFVGNYTQPMRAPARRKGGFDRAIIRQHIRDDREFNFINPVYEYAPDGSTIVPPGPSEVPSTMKLLALNLNVDSFTGNYKDNTAAKIANFVVGLDRGLIKGVKFDRVDQPFLRESRTATSKNFGTGQLRELYHVTLTLYGNNLLKPGMLIYVEPNPLIFGRPSDVSSAARVLGLGGYHLVIDVANDIGSRGWTTTIKALHMAMPALPSVTATITSASPTP